MTQSPDHLSATRGETLTPPTATPVVAPALATGFGSAVVAWVLAWVLHHPAIDARAGVTLPVLLVALVVAFALLLRAHPAPGRLRAGLLGGLVCGLVNLLIVSSAAVKQPGSTAEMAQYANQFSDQAVVIIPATIALCVVAGAVGALLARGGRGGAATRTDWLARFGLVTALVYLPLIVVGGAVTSTESGLAVPDSVTTYGAVSVLFPFELMSNPRIFLEHSHRLFGTLAGLTTLVLMVSVLVGTDRRAPKLLSVALFGMVCLQGFMGAKRVSEMSTVLAIAHGVFGQIVFATAGLLACTLSNAWRTLGDDEDRRASARKGVTVAALTVGALLLQLALGAAARHLGHTEPPNPGAAHARLTHAGFSFVAMGLIIVLGAMAIRAGKSGAGFKGIRRLGASIHGVVTVQFLLGWASLGLVMTSRAPRAIPTSDQLDAAPPIRVGEALVTTAHQATGAVLLLLTVATAAWVFRLARKARPR